MRSAGKGAVMNLCAVGARDVDAGQLATTQTGAVAMTTVGASSMPAGVTAHAIAVAHEAVTRALLDHHAEVRARAAIAVAHRYGSA